MASAGDVTLLSGELTAEATALVAIGDARGLDCVGTRLRNVDSAFF